MLKRLLDVFLISFVFNVCLHVVDGKLALFAHARISIEVVAWHESSAESGLGRLSTRFRKPPVSRLVTEADSSTNNIWLEVVLNHLYHLRSVHFDRSFALVSICREKVARLLSIVHYLT